MTLESDTRIESVKRFYELLDELARRVGGTRTLGECSGQMTWPKRGVYFFFEPEERRHESGIGFRLVRIGTHALKRGARTSLWDRLSTHRGTKKTRGGNHRGSIFRLLVGTALIERDKLEFPTWGNGSSAPKHIRDEEHELEILVSQFIGEMPFLWLGINDLPGPESLRGVVERNSIALLSNFSRAHIDWSSDGWLGHYCARDKVRASGLWNQKHIDEECDVSFLNILEQFVHEMQRGT